MNNRRSETMRAKQRWRDGKIQEEEEETGDKFHSGVIATRTSCRDYYTDLKTTYSAFWRFPFPVPVIIRRGLFKVETLHTDIHLNISKRGLFKVETLHTDIHLNISRRGLFKVETLNTHMNLFEVATLHCK